MTTPSEFEDLSSQFSEILRNFRVVADEGMRDTLQVRHLMTNKVHTLREGDNLLSLAHMMREMEIRHVPVVNEFGTLVGLLTERDLLQAMVSNLAEIDADEAKALYSSIEISKLMRRKIVTVEPSTPLEQAAKVMFEEKLGCLPVMDGSKLVGILTEADYVRFFSGL